jgi:hypothetical protein
MFRDDKSVVDSSSRSHGKLHKRHNALLFHYISEAIVSKFVNFTFLDGMYNPANIISKDWDYQQVWTMINQILFFHGDSAELYEDDCYDIRKCLDMFDICLEFGRRSQANGE